jgi:hypothetical protein
MIEHLGRTEDWHETVERCCNGILEIGGRFTGEQIARLAYYQYMLKGSMAGRPTWQLGTDTVRRIGGDSMQNCWHVAVNDPIDPFTFAFNQLMLGGGVGFNILPEHVYELPPVRHRVRVERVDELRLRLHRHRQPRGLGRAAPADAGRASSTPGRTSATTPNASARRGAQSRASVGSRADPRSWSVGSG